MKPQAADSKKAPRARCRSYPVKNDDLDLLGFLDAARRREGTALPVLADWLEDRDDPRAGGLRDLLTGLVTIPESLTPRQFVTVAEGPGWVISRSQVMIRMSLVAESRLHTLLGRELLYSEQLLPIDRSVVCLHRVIERYRRRAAFTLFQTDSHDIEMRAIITAALLSQEDKDAILRSYHASAAPTLRGVTLTVRRREVKVHGSAIMRADGEELMDRFTAVREFFCREA